MATCAKCERAIPAYVGGCAGFVQPTPPRTRKTEPHDAEAAFVKFTQGSGGMTATAIDAPVCAGCYLELFSVANPGAALPVMPDAIG
jgi:hypothetical protein